MRFIITKLKTKPKIIDYLKQYTACYNFNTINKLSHFVWNTRYKISLQLFINYIKFKREFK